MNKVFFYISPSKISLMCSGLVSSNLVGHVDFIFGAKWHRALRSCRQTDKERTKRLLTSSTATNTTPCIDKTRPNFSQILKPQEIVVMQFRNVDWHYCCSQTVEGSIGICPKREWEAARELASRLDTIIAGISADKYYQISFIPSLLSSSSCLYIHGCTIGIYNTNLKWTGGAFAKLVCYI